MGDGRLAAVEEEPVGAVSSPAPLERATMIHLADTTGSNQSLTKRTATALAVVLMMATSAAGAEPAGVGARADQAFERLDQALRNSPALQPVKESTHSGQATTYSADQYVIGVGHGDLSKGRITCQRVAELSARSELAKQIRVLIKEHAVDRTRERSGHPAEQDLEVTREEIVQEYLQGVKIVDRQIDETAGLCKSTAVMPRATLGASSTSEPRESGSASSR